MDADGSWKHYKLEEFVDFVNFLLSFEGFRTQKRLHFFPFYPFCGYIHAPQMHKSHTIWGVVHVFIT